MRKELENLKAWIFHTEDNILTTSKIKPGHILSSAKEQRDSHAICLENKNTVILHAAEITKVQKRA